MLQKRNTHKLSNDMELLAFVHVLSDEVPSPSAKLNVDITQWPGIRVRTEGQDMLSDRDLSRICIHRSLSTVSYLYKG